MSNHIDTQNIKWAKDTSSFGRKLLEKMGWAEGEGIGRDKEGTTTHVKVSRRSENLALGYNQDSHGNAAHSARVEDFTSLLTDLAAHHPGRVVGAGTKKRVRSLSTASDHHHEIPFESVRIVEEDDERGDAKRSKKEKKSKKKKSSKKSKKKKNSEPKTKHFVHRKVSRAKNVSSYSATDMKAIFGQK